MFGRTLSRRELLLAGVGLGLAGCAQKVVGPAPRPRPWPVLAERPRRVYTPPPRPPLSDLPHYPAAAGVDPTTAAIPRSAWAKAGPITSRLNPLGQVSFITVHHEGWTAVDFSDVASTAARLESIRRSHLERMTAGDIGYHFIVDRAGRLWQGRDLRYQGAHVRNHNPHNIGIMVLGNFDRQRPTPAQYATLQSTLRHLMQRYHVGVGRVHTHRELGPTTCPGSVLQAHVIGLRRTGLA